MGSPRARLSTIVGYPFVVLAAFLGVVATTSVAESAGVVSATGSSTTVTAPGSGAGTALLTNVQVGTANGKDTVTFSFTGPSLPGVVVSTSTGLTTVAGDPVTISGAALLAVRMFPASAFDSGVRCAEAAPDVTPGAGQQAVGVAFTCQNPTAGPWPATNVGRAVAASADQAVLLPEAIEQLLGGPTVAEQNAGFSSPFTTASAGKLISATIQPDGTAIVDLDASLASIIPSPTPSVGQQILRSLDATINQFTDVTSAEYRLGGSCAAFYSWVGGTCAARTKDQLASSTFARTYTGPSRVTGASVNVTEAVEASDFEATLVWGIGLRTAVSVTVRTDTASNQVIVEIPQAAATVVTVPAAVTATPVFTG